MGAGGFVTLAGHFTDRTVVTYDPRGVERSTKADPASPSTPEEHADDLHRIIAELDRHLPEAPHLAIAATGQQRLRRHVRRKGHGVDSLHAERAKPLLAAIDELGPETATAQLATDDADCDTRVVVLLDPPHCNEPAVLLE